ncbi:MAG: hypothetical protein HYY93_07955 [Planctomycetes bacterium]|nr:hypothetical protein [Planctomycetota bacterium]
MIPTDVLHVRCVGCSRRFEIPRDRLVALAREGRAICQYCGGILEMPEEVRVALASAPPADSPAIPPLKFPCPFCDRLTCNDPFDIETTLRCSFCGGQFLSPPREGSGARALPVEGPLATADEVDRATAVLPDTGIYRFAREALRIRAARGEVGRADVEGPLAGLSALTRWGPSVGDRAIVPLPLTECERLIPALLFDMTASAVDRREGSTALFFERGEAGLLDSGALGTGLATQIDTHPAKPNPKATADLARTIHEFKPVFEKYYGLTALFGAGLGLTAARVSPPRAIETRMRSLGGWVGENASALAEELSLARPRA